MITTARNNLEFLEANPNTRDEDARALLREIPDWQWGIWFKDLKTHCPDRRTPDPIRRPANALNVEIGQPSARCLRQSPDGRGSAWLLSGGDLLVYGVCRQSQCPYCVTDKASRAFADNPDCSDDEE